MLIEPLIPYIDLPDLQIIPKDIIGGNFPPAPLSFKPFGTLVAIGVYLGAYVMLRQGKRLGFNQQALTSFMIWVLAGGFIGGHVLDTLFYYPQRVVENPLSLLAIWNGQSSFGGFIGAIGGGFAWRRSKGVPILPYSDVVASGFPVGWLFGRAGCTVAHDHPGRLSDMWIAVQYPDGGRFDLGLYEFVLTIPVVVAFLILQRRPRPWGFYLGVMMIAYAPARFALDFLRARDVPGADPRYGMLTPAQWACFGMLALGGFFFFRAQASAGDVEAFRVPTPPRRALAE